MGSFVGLASLPPYKSWYRSYRTGRLTGKARGYTLNPRTCALALIRDENMSCAIWRDTESKLKLEGADLLVTGAYRHGGLNVM